MGRPAGARHLDGSAGDADYGTIGAGYSAYRRPEPRFLASFTVHQWSDLTAGLREVRRVTRGRVVVLTCDPTVLGPVWLRRYAPEVIATEAGRYPTIDVLTAALGGRVSVTALPIPRDCRDGFSEAYYGRPEALLDPGARRANSAWSFVDDGVVERFERTLRADLASGSWVAEFGFLRESPNYDGSLRLLVAETAHG